MPQEVQDKPTESGIKINNILTALILMVITWVGVSIESIKNNISTITATQKVNEIRITNIEDRTSRIEKKLE